MDRDYYRCIDTDSLLELARERGIDPDMAVVFAERLQGVAPGETTGGRYTFNHRSEK